MGCRIALLFLILWTNIVYSQSYKFKKFIEQDGLNNRFVYTIDQDEKGNLMVGTGEGLYRFDGFNFEELSSDQGLKGNFLTCSAMTSEGAILYGHDKGLITKYQQDVFEHFDISNFTQSRINAIMEDNKKNLWVLTQNDGLLKRSPDSKWEQFIKGIEDLTLYSFCIDDFGRLWLGTDMGLLLGSMNNKGEVVYEFINQIIETKVAAIWKNGNQIIIGTDDSGIFSIETTEKNFNISPLLCNGNNLSWLSVNSFYYDNTNNLWICTNNEGLIQLSGLSNGQYKKLIKYHDGSQVKTSSMRICKTDREGTIWVGTMGDGLLKLSDNYFSVFAYSTEKNSADIFSIFESNDTIWSGGTSTIYISVQDPTNVIDSIGEKNGTPDGQITAIFKDQANNLWVGNTNGKLRKLPSGSRKFITISAPTEMQQQKINDILGVNDFIYVATDYGIYQFKNDKLISHISIQSGLSHNVAKSLFRDSNGKIWIATNNSQITYIEEGVIKNIPAPEDNMLIQIRCITEDNSGNIWIGTDGLGLMKITGENLVVFNKNNGLYSDYCYSVVCDNRNKIWVGHHGAVSKVNILNNAIEIFDPGSGFDMVFNDNAVERTSSGIILFGTNKGILRYEPDKDSKNQKEPILHFNKVLINDSTQKDIGLISLSFGEYRIAFDFIGVSLKNPSKVSYQYFLEGYDSDWCDPTTDHFKDYGKLGPGEYTFKVKAYNSDGYGGTVELEVRIFIDKPFWLKWWFIVICIVVFIISVRYIIIRREKFLRETQERLKVALDERTREVVEQKELLEEKNKDITDSIQYARNIQNAMMPPIDALKNFFEDAFVYYKPRDIVSGDFYWVEKFNETIVVSCADCTGHGVPGAFMSLIGSTLLKDVSGKKYVQSSREVLIHLDDELSRMLNKQSDLSIEDGMDIVVFDYHPTTNKLKIASANRPVFFYHRGEMLDLKGDRQSIGGSHRESKKEFSQYEFEVQKGDIIYLFSDGITDQFGGPNEKKLKKSGLLTWVQQSVHLPLDEQRKRIKENFHNWIGDRDQLDDIIFIGIKF